MPNIDAMFPSKYLKAADLDNKEWHVTIKSVSIENVGTEDDPEDKPVLHFTNARKGMVLNRTNAASIANMFGKDTDRWAGQLIALYCTQVLFRSQMVDSIRIRPATAAQPHPAPVQAPGPQFLPNQAQAPMVPATGPSDDMDSDIPF